MERDAILHAESGPPTGDGVPEAEVVDVPTAPSGVAVNAMDESADTERESLDETYDIGNIGKKSGAARPSLARHRRQTVVSPIPSLLAASMSPQGASEGTVAARPKPSQLVHGVAKARATLASGDRLSAYLEAEVAVEAAIDNGELLSPVFRREAPKLMQIYAGYLGDLDAAPMLKIPPEVWERQDPSPESRAVLERVNGLRTLRDILRDTGLDAFSQLRVAAQLFASGHIRWG